MEMHQIRYFLAVCETLNFTRAAERCNVSQPALTRAVKHLEDELGAQLLRRERARTHLTDLGRLMKARFEEVFAATEAAQIEAREFVTLTKAPLKLGVMCTMGPAVMVPFFDRLRQDIPSMDLTIRDATGEQLIEAMMAGELDIAFIGMPKYPERLHQRPLYSERYVIAFAKGHRFEQMNAVPLRELDGEDYLTRLNCELYAHFEEFLKMERPYELNRRYSSEREDWIQCMIAAGMGCSVVPETMQMLPGICQRVVTEPEIERRISLVTVAGRRFSPAVQALESLAVRYDWGRSASDR
jgi:DNA-binding transcriptional LysR family regulator